MYYFISEMKMKNKTWLSENKNNKTIHYIQKNQSEIYVQTKLNKQNY